MSDDGGSETGHLCVEGGVIFIPCTLRWMWFVGVRE